MKIRMCVNPNCPLDKIQKGESCQGCGERLFAIGFSDSFKIITLKKTIKNHEREPMTPDEITKLHEDIIKPEPKSKEQIQKEEIETGIFKGYNAKQKNKNTTITLTDNGLEVITERRHIVGGLGEENIIPYSSIQGVTIKRHGLGKVVEIKTMAETFKFRIFNTTAFVDMLNEKINSV